MPIRNPPIDVAAIDAGGRFTKDWYDRFKYLDTLQPLSDVDFTAINAAIALKSDTLRSINDQTGTSYTFVLGDSGKYCRFTNAAAIAVTIPTNASVALTVGTQIDLFQGGAGKVTFGGSGVTINSFLSRKSLAGQGAGGTLVKVATNTWDLVGSLIA